MRKLPPLQPPVARGVADRRRRLVAEAVVVAAAATAAVSLGFLLPKVLSAGAPGRCGGKRGAQVEQAMSHLE